MNPLNLPLAYPIVVEGNIAYSLSLFLSRQHYSQLFVLCDTHTQQHCYPLLQASLPTHHLISIPAGEAHKTLDTCRQIWEQLTAHAADRSALLINLGGGVLCDMGGFCAATYKRGIRFIHCPTTLLSQLDASIGGKLGVDFMGLKNHIGVFQDPLAVFIGTVFLQTLPSREITAGFAEHIKHLLIADEAGWQELLQADSLPIHPATIARSLGIKAGIVAADPHEKGLRKALNFGHTIGHALESYFLQSRQALLHGEAVALGIKAEAYISLQRGYIQPGEYRQIAALIDAHYPAVTLNKEDMKAIATLCVQDKKNEGGKILCTLLGGIGKVRINEAVSKEEIEQALLQTNVPVQIHGNHE
ncbi:MAG: 3-dehydroquinate synthase [Thermonema sp.]|uniref:3-dehydroquinate synthase n=1 Tax=Thermonema sp. TaxID=2231181 RepID=UPI0021DDE086|nr:3-dehydroquinate synthase [Thermonema sp.]GIV40299.1 MAG: 3-dehydroquinate synthase [Thermonema sp.]